jgi:hypothetical protein
LKTGLLWAKRIGVKEARTSASVIERKSRTEVTETRFFTHKKDCPLEAATGTEAGLGGEHRES